MLPLLLRLFDNSQAVKYRLVIRQFAKRGLSNQLGRLPCAVAQPQKSSNAIGSNLLVHNNCIKVFQIGISVQALHYFSIYVNCAKIPPLIGSLILGRNSVARKPFARESVKRKKMSQLKKTVKKDSFILKSLSKSIYL